MKKLVKIEVIAVVCAVIMFSLYFAGCATYVPIKSVRPPTIDTSNIQRLAIKDFENRSSIGGPVGAQITQYLTDKSREIIPAAGKFTIVAAADPNADGVFTGELRSISWKDSASRSERKDKNGNIIVTITHRREISLSFVYTVIDSRSGTSLGQISKQGSTSTTSSDQSTLTDLLTLAKSIVDTQLRSLQSDIVPTIVSTSHRLMDETSKDKFVKQRMKAASVIVKNGNYVEAIRQYDEIDSEYGSTAARTNAKLLRDSIASDIAARAKLTELFNNTSGLAEKAVKNTVDTLYSKLPSGASIIVMKTNSTERNMLDSVVDQIITTVVQERKLRVVDRSNQTLINVEQQYQLSGNVSDDSIVSIGHQLGVQYIVLCWISGVMSTRQFNQRILNVETAQIIDQNSFDI